MHTARIPPVDPSPATITAVDRPPKRSVNEALPSSVSNGYSLSIRTHGSSCRRRASSSLRRVSSFSASSSSSRAASHSLRVPVMCFVIALLSFLRVSFIVRSFPSHVRSTYLRGRRFTLPFAAHRVLRRCHVACWLRGQEGDHPRDLLCLTKALPGNKLRHALANELLLLHEQPLAGGGPRISRYDRRSLPGCLH